MEEQISDGENDKRNAVCTALGKSLKGHRIAAQISQAELATRSEVDRTYVSQIERGVGNPSILTLANLCFGIGITLAELFATVKEALPPDGGSPRRANRAKPQSKPLRKQLR